MKNLLTFALFIVAGLSSQAAEAPVRPKNVILMIGDGMGFHQVEAGSLYRYGRPDGQIYRSFTSLASSTYSLNNTSGYNPASANSDFNYVTQNPTDSAAAATALSTGQKTLNKHIGLSREGQPLRHLMEDAEDLGKATGVLTTVYFSHATPAGFIAHAESRDDYAEIANQMLWESRADVIIGAGHPLYDEDGQRVSAEIEAATPHYSRVGGQESWNKILQKIPGADADGDGKADAWTLVDTRQGIRALASGSTPKRVLGLVPVYSTLQQGRSGNSYALPYAVNPLTTSPTMKELMAAALNTLSKDPDGFVLMAEGGAIDWTCHGNQSGRLIEEQIDFDRAVEYVIEWIEANSNWEETLLVVTADHECGYLTGPGSDPYLRTLTNNGAGFLPGMEWHSSGHTNQLVPLYVKGAGENELTLKARSTDPQHGLYMENTDITQTVRELWRKSETEKPEFAVKPYLQMTTQTSTRILWETTLPAQSQVLFSAAELNTKTPKLNQDAQHEGFRHFHEIELTGLQAETNYFYKVVSTAENGQTVESAIYSFQTAVNADTPYAFTVFSDTQTNPSVWGTIAELAWRERPNFALHGGDIVGTGTNKEQWVHDFLNPGHVFMSRLPIYAILGNHDKNADYYYQYIANPQPEYYYTFQYGNAQFFLFDSCRDLSPGSEIYTWLNDQLAQSSAPWKFVVQHHPPYTSDENDYGDTYSELSLRGDPDVQPLIPLYEKYGVDAVFFGHIHDYERTWPIYENQVNSQKGVRYIQVGGSGGGLENYAPTRSWFTAKVHRDHHFCLVAIHGKHLEFQAIDQKGNVFDTFTLDK